MKTGRKTYTETYITEALLLLLDKKRYEDIPITEICRKAGVTRTSFYRHFETKDDILSRKTRSITNTFLKESQISYKNDPFGSYFSKLFSHMHDHLDFCHSLRKANKFYLIKEEFERVFLNTYKEDYDMYKSAFLAGGIYNIFYFWFMSGCKEEPALLAEKLDNLFVK